MCIFNTPVSEVSSTNIFVCETSDGKQLTVYKNYVDFQFNSLDGRRKEDKIAEKRKEAQKIATPAMILPFPQGDVELIDLTEHENFFQKLNDCFPSLHKLTRSRKKGTNSSSLEVVKVGSYDVSVANSIEDLRNIDQETFQISENVDQILGQHYSSNFGFLICKIRDNEKKHPFGYVHSKLDKEKLFVPTRHEHGNDDGDSKKAHFDHILYSLNTDQQAGKSTLELTEELNQNSQVKTGDSSVREGITVKEALSNFPVEITVSDKLLRRLEKKGDFENEDMIFEEAA